MLRKLLSLFAFLAIGTLILGGAFASPSEENDPAKAVTKVSVKSGARYDGKVPEAYPSLEAAIKKGFKDATFQFKDGTLLVGTNAAAKNEEILEITWKSDCPVNSKFEVTSTPTLANADQVIKTTLVALTEDRHPHLRGNEVETYTAPKGKKWYQWGEVVLKQ